MVTFENPTKKTYPYDRTQYFFFTNDEITPAIAWFGFSLQLKEKNYNTIQSINVLDIAFKTIISKYDNGSFWIINHEVNNIDWFFDDSNNLKSLRTLFKEHRIQNSFKGTLICFKNDLFKHSRDLISYPFILSYKNLDISHNALPLIVKTSNHLTIDVLSTDITLLNEIINSNSFKNLSKVKYRGSEKLL